LEEHLKQECPFCGDSVIDQIDMDLPFEEEEEEE